MSSNFSNFVLHTLILGPVLPHPVRQSRVFEFCADRSARSSFPSPTLNGGRWRFIYFARVRKRDVAFCFCFGSYTESYCCPAAPAETFALATVKRGLNKKKKKMDKKKKIRQRRSGRETVTGEEGLRRYQSVRARNSDVLI